MSFVHCQPSRCEKHTTIKSFRDPSPFHERAWRGARVLIYYRHKPRGCAPRIKRTYNTPPTAVQQSAGYSYRYAFVVTFLCVKHAQRKVTKRNGGFSGRCPIPRKPLKRLDRNFLNLVQPQGLARGSRALVDHRSGRNPLFPYFPTTLLVQNLNKDLKTLVDLILGNGERWQKSYYVRACGKDQKSLLCCSFYKG